MHASLILLSLCLSAADNDCNSLLSTRAAKNATNRNYLQFGKCIITYKPEGTIRDNHVDFVGIYGATLLEVNFKPIWFTLTRPQPIERDCVISEDKIQRVKILAGRQKTAEVREEFEDGPLKPENMVCSNVADDQIGKFVPNELNFVFDGLMTFTFALKNSSFSRTVRLRLAQGSFERVLTAGNNWWIASKDCNVSVVAKTFICNDIDGKGQMGIKSDGNYVTRKNHKFRVFPWPT